MASRTSRRRSLFSATRSGCQASTDREKAPAVGSGWRRSTSATSTACTRCCLRRAARAWLSAMPYNQVDSRDSPRNLDSDSYAVRNVSCSTLRASSSSRRMRTMRRYRRGVSLRTSASKASSSPLRTAASSYSYVAAEAPCMILKSVRWNPKVRKNPTPPRWCRVLCPELAAVCKSGALKPGPGLDDFRGCTVFEFLEVLGKELAQAFCRAVVRIAVGPRVARNEDFGRHAGAFGWDLEPERGVGCFRRALQIAAVDRVDDGACVLEAHPLAGAVGAAGEAGVYEPRTCAVAAHAVGQHLSVAARVQHEERRTEAR